MRGVQHVHLPDVHVPRRDTLQELRGQCDRARRRADPSQDRLAGPLRRIRALVRTAVAPLLAEPTVAATQLSQVLRGHELELIEERGTWWLARGADDYEGWIHERDDRRMTHVAISAGGPDVVHLAVARGGYAVESLDSDDPVSAALKSRFLFGRRVLPDTAAGQL